MTRSLISTVLSRSLLLAVLIAPSVEAAPGAQVPPTSQQTKPTLRSTTKQTAKPAAQPAATEEKQVQGSAIAARIESATRQVDVKSGDAGNWKKAKNQTQLKVSDQVKTGSRSVARLKLGDGSKVLLLQNSQAEMENLTSVQKTIKLLRGRVRAIVSKIKGGNNFKIKTPVGVASVRGTDFEVEVSEDGQQMSVDVHSGQVGVSKLGDLADEILVNPGERIRFGLEGEIGDPIRSGAIPLNRQDVRAEVQSSRVKDSIFTMAAEELRDADYQVGKSLIDVTGQRVRVEEYITRPAANQFKLVVLNERPTRFDYFTYKGTFNTTLPEDLSIALGQVRGTFGTTAPDYYLTGYETFTSNTVDNITDVASGGHLVKVEFDGTNYTLTDNADSSNVRVIEAAQFIGNDTYKIYNPSNDTYTTATTAGRDEALKVSIRDGVGNYRNLASGDTIWKTRFNNYTSHINSTLKFSYAKKTAITNTLAIDLDATLSAAPISIINENPSGNSSLHNRLTLFYSDGSKTVYDNYIIDDEGVVAPADSFAGLSSSAAYREELDKWNYQQRVTSTEMNGRNIDLVVDPRIGTMSGLIQ